MINTKLTTLFATLILLTVPVATQAQAFKGARCPENPYTNTAGWTFLTPKLSGNFVFANVIIAPEVYCSYYDTNDPSKSVVISKTGIFIPRSERKWSTNGHFYCCGPVTQGPYYNLYCRNLFPPTPAGINTKQCAYYPRSGIRVFMYKLKGIFLYPSKVYEELKVKESGKPQVIPVQPTPSELPQPMPAPSTTGPQSAPTTTGQ